jgi:transport and Golgi organization protein 2
LPPTLHQLGQRKALYPSEPGGGTWIGVNDAAVTFALINWYSVTSRVRDKVISRGDIVTSALTADTPERATEILNAASLPRVNPFRLIGVFPKSRDLVEWRWNLKQLEALDHPWATNIWISSGFDEPGAQQTRGKVFQSALRQPSVGTLDWLRRLHRSHAPEMGPYSICMHRDDAATVSYTEISASGVKASMLYRVDSRCSSCCDLSSRIDLLHSRPTGIEEKGWKILFAPATRQGCINSKYLQPAPNSASAGRFATLFPGTLLTGLPARQARRKNPARSRLGVTW